MMQDDVIRRLWRRRLLCLVAIGGAACLICRPTFAAGGSGACSSNVEARQLDYWLGSWTVAYPGDSGHGSSRVHLSLDKCLLVESWDSGTGLKGENTFAYDPEEKAWHGLYADNHGRVHVFEGTVKPGYAEFAGPGHGPQGEKVLNRVKVVRVSLNKVEQTWEKSADNGATWKLEFRGDYSRQSP